MKVKMISLGCSKNLVDSEMVLGLFDKNDITEDLDSADFVIINTCGFIEPAKKESIDMILDMSSIKKTIVIGCLVERYYDELVKDIPEVFLYVRLKDYLNIKEIFNNKLNTKITKSFCEQNRKLLTPSHLAYVRISDGCNNNCTYCAIPLIRGKFKSRIINDIKDEVSLLVKKGIKEIVLISQDTSRYGMDINCDIISLLKELETIKGIMFIRLLYLYPIDVTKKLIDHIANSNIVMPYFDIPIQHASDKVLKDMNRRGTAKDIKEMIEYIRRTIKDAVIRTTLIVGFPTETKDDFNILKEFIKQNKFDRLGVFTYSKEEDTKAYELPDMDESIKQDRFEEIMFIQEEIAYELGQTRIKQIHTAIIEEIDDDAYIARSYAFAPDDIDGYIFIKRDKTHRIGDIISVNIYDADSYNLYANEI